MGDVGTNGKRAAAGARHEPHDSAAILRILLDYLPSAVTVFGPDLEMVACSTKLKELLGFPDELFAAGPPSLATLLRFNALRGEYGPGDPEKIVAKGLERARNPEAHVFERTRPNGTVLDIRGTPLPDGGFVTVYTDITELKRAELALRESEAELRLLTDNVPAMILYVDRQMRCGFANQRYADFFGLEVADIVGKHLRDIVGSAAYAQLEQHFERGFEGHPVVYQRGVRLPNGVQRLIEVKLVPRVAKRGQILGCYSLAMDVTEQEQAAIRIQHLAHHDALTGVPNRLLFNDRLGQAISLAKRDARQFALLYLDLDKFKPVNDTFGHDIGDELLKGTADRIRHQVRESDTVARVGGDEFTVILHDVANRESAATVAEKIIAALTAPFQLGSQKRQVEIGTSVGIAFYPGDGQDHETLIKMADAAMYRAKKRGCCYFFCGQ